MDEDFVTQYAYSKPVRVLITGHTGFKGSWMAALLATQNYEVHGLSHEVADVSHFALADVGRYLKSDSRIDVRDSAALSKSVSRIKPDIVIHLAAQALVREGYRKPFETFDTNVNGTINVIKSCQYAEVSYLLVITSDKVYQESLTNKTFSELDPLGGSDPYSASKAAADIVAQSLANQIEGITISIARAGNVIGGGDFGQERLIPDLYRAQIDNTAALIRNPNAVRPWQHVLDCVDGYIKILNHMTRNGGCGVWNVGPRDDAELNVHTVCEKFSQHFNNPRIFKVSDEEESSMRESPFLRLNSAKINKELGWSPKLITSSAIEWTLDWYLGLLKGQTASKLTESQINKYLDM